MNVCITESLDKKNSPNSESVVQVVRPASVSDRSNIPPLGSGLLHKSL